jgi:hypothetical protein
MIPKNLLLTHGLLNCEDAFAIHLLHFGSTPQPQAHPSAIGEHAPSAWMMNVLVEKRADLLLIDGVICLRAGILLIETCARGD